MPNLIRDRKVSLTVTLPACVEHAVFEQAEMRGVTRSEMIADLLIRALEVERLRPTPADTRKEKRG